MLQNLGLDGSKCLLVIDANDPLIIRAGRNLRKLATTSANQVNTYEVLWAEHVLITSAALDALKEVRA